MYKLIFDLAIINKITSLSFLVGTTIMDFFFLLDTISMEWSIVYTSEVSGFTLKINIEYFV